MDPSSVPSPYIRRLSVVVCACDLIPVEETGESLGLTVSHGSPIIDLKTQRKTLSQKPVCTMSEEWLEFGLWLLHRHMCAHTCRQIPVCIHTQTSTFTASVHLEQNLGVYISNSSWVL